MKTVVIAVALTTALSPPSPATAATGSRYYGRCAVTPVRPAGAGPTQQADLYAVTALFSTTPAGNPVTATVTCQVRVDGTVAASVGETGTAAVVVHGSVTWSADHTNVVEVCTVVDYADPTPTATHCGQIGVYLPPQELLELLDAMFVELADPVVCPALKARAPGAGPVFINEQGDVYVLGTPQWDCPPYDIWGR